MAFQLENLQKNGMKHGSGGEMTRITIRTVAEEIAGEAAKEILDPFALGVHFAKIESFRRKMSENNRQLLSTTQTAKLDALNEAFRLRATSRCDQSIYVFIAPAGTFGFSLFGTYLGDCPDRRALDEPQ